jgi:hypothetical protein
VTVLFSALETVLNLAAPMLTGRIAAVERSLAAYDVPAVANVIVPV